MAITIADGKHRAHLRSVETRQNSSGNPFLAFTWELADGSGDIYSYTNLTDKAGNRNEKGIALVRRWAKGWDGQNPEWFDYEGYNRVLGTEVELVIENRPWYKDPSRIYAQVRWVNPVNGSAAAAPKTDTRPEELTGEASADPFMRNPGGQLMLPDFIKPNMLDVWEAFMDITPGVDYRRREEFWLKLIDATVPGKDQDLFTDEDWQKVIDYLKAL